jgi:hypothetical protein
MTHGCGLYSEPVTEKSGLYLEPAKMMTDDRKIGLPPPPLMKAATWYPQLLKKRMESLFPQLIG